MAFQFNIERIATLTAEFLEHARQADAHFDSLHPAEAGAMLAASQHFYGDDTKEFVERDIEKIAALVNAGRLDRLVTEMSLYWEKGYVAGYKAAEAASYPHPSARNLAGQTA